MTKSLKDNTIDKLMQIGDKIIGIISRFIIFIWILAYAAINISVIKEIIELSNGFMFYVYIAAFIFVLLLTSFIIVKLKPLFEGDKRSLIWFGLGLIIRLTSFGAQPWYGLVICLVVPLAFYIFLKKKDLFWIALLFCAAAEVLVPDFVTTYLPFFAAIYIYKYGIRLEVKNRKALICTIAAVVVYALGIFRSFFFSDEYIAQLMNFQFYTDYAHFGFCTRGLLASIIYLILGYNRNWYAVKMILLVMHILCSLGIICVSYLIYKEIPEKYKDAGAVIWLSIIVSGALRYMGSITSVMYMDCLLIFITMLCIYIMINARCTFLIPVLCGIAMCFHHVFGILCFPFLFMIMCYRYITYKKKSDIAVLIISSITVVLLFIYFQFAAYRFIPISLNEGMNYLEAVMGNSFSEKLTQTFGYVVYNGKVESYGVQFESFSLDDYAGLSGSLVFNLLLLGPEILIIKTFIKNSGRKLWGFTAFAQFIALISYMEIDYFRWDITIAVMVATGLMSLLAIDQEGSWLLSFSNEEKKKRFLDYLFIVILIIIPSI